MTTDNKGSAQEIEYILASYTDRNGTGCRADLELCISICTEKCSKVPAFVELAEHHYGDHLRMMRRLLDALPALLSARAAPEALLWHIMVAGPAGYMRREAFAGSSLAEALENVRKQGFAWVEDEDSGFPDVLMKMAAPEALGAAKGELIYAGVTVAECLENMQGIVDADWRKWEELASPEEFVRWAKSRCNAIIAKAKGEKA